MPIMQEGQYAPPVHMIKLTATLGDLLPSGCIRMRRDDGALVMIVIPRARIVPITVGIKGAVLKQKQPCDRA
jgi:hypothetical protein